MQGTKRVCNSTGVYIAWKTCMRNERTCTTCQRINTIIPKSKAMDPIPRMVLVIPTVLLILILRVDAHRRHGDSLVDVVAAVSLARVKVDIASTNIVRLCPSSLQRQYEQGVDMLARSKVKLTESIDALHVLRSDLPAPDRPVCTSGLDNMVTDIPRQVPSMHRRCGGKGQHHHIGQLHRVLIWPWTLLAALLRCQVQMPDL